VCLPEADGNYFLRQERIVYGGIDPTRNNKNDISVFRNGLEN
jgi:hypothetical protein